MDKLVIIIDDGPAITALLKKALEIQGYRVHVLERAEDTSAVIVDEIGRIDIRLTDIIMPITDGGELIWKVKKHHPLARGRLAETLKKGKDYGKNLRLVQNVSWKGGR